MTTLINRRFTAVCAAALAIVGGSAVAGAETTTPTQIDDQQADVPYGPLAEFGDQMPVLDEAGERIGYIDRDEYRATVFADPGPPGSPEFEAASARPMIIPVRSYDDSSVIGVTAPDGVLTLDEGVEAGILTIADAERLAAG